MYVMFLKNPNSKIIYGYPNYHNHYMFHISAFDNSDVRLPKAVIICSLSRDTKIFLLIAMSNNASSLSWDIDKCMGVLTLLRVENERSEKQLSD